MKIITRKITSNLSILLLGAMLPALTPAWAESDKQLQEKTLKARESLRHEGMDHSAHGKPADATEGFRGVFYGYLPCELEDCDGFKMTLSLKQKNNYLLVTQYARESSRENYDKGKYQWDDQARLLTLNSGKDGSKRMFTIKENGGSLILLASDGKPLPGNQSAYQLDRSDKGKTREVHIH